MAISVNTALFDEFPKKLDENQFSALLKLISLIDSKGDIIKVNDDEFEGLFQFGRDRTEQTIAFLADKKYIKREQKRDQKGQFDYNEITILTNYVSDR